MKPRSPAHYFSKYLRISPLSHAVWRACEASSLSEYAFKQPILDIGCGFGEFAGVFFSSRVEVGIDINEREAAQAMDSGKYKRALTADARKLPFGNRSFNTVISMSVLEHIPDRAQVFHEAFRVLKPGGLFMYTVPTKNLYQTLLGVKVLLFLRLNEVAKKYYESLNKVFVHHSLPTPKQWVRLATDAGFLIRESKGTVSAHSIAAWELGLPLALPSQLLKWWTGRRVVIGGKIRGLVFSWVKRFVNCDPTCMANILVVAQKPL